MNFGFSTFFFLRKPINRVIEEIIAHGVKTIELSLEIPHMPNMDDEFVKRMTALCKAGIDFSIHAPFFEMNLGSYQKEIRLFSKKKARLAIDMAQRIGANPVVMHPGYSFWMDKLKDVAERSREYFIKDMKGILSYARKRSIIVALEPIPMHFFFFYDLPEFKELQEMLPGIGMTLDIGHAYVTKVSKKTLDPEGAIIEDLKDLGVRNVSHVHLHNNKGKRDEHLVSEGNIDTKRILSFLSEEGYTGKVIVESYEMERNGITTVMEKLKSLAP
jgi:sugar phosphate isomerase/epimerase